MNKDSAYNSRYGLRELEQLAQDHESDDVLRRRLRSESLVENAEFMDSAILKSNVEGSGVKGIEKNRRSNGIPQDYSFENAHHTSYSAKTDVSSSSVTHLKSTFKLGKGVKSDALDGVGEDSKDANTEPDTPVSVRRSSSNFTVPQPFNLSSQSQASIRSRPGNSRAGQDMQKPMGLRGEINSKAHLSRNCEPKLMPQTYRDQESSRQFPCHDKLGRDDDVVSVSSIQSRQNIQTPKANASKFTNTNAFKLQSDARAEKRKEFYSKLQERLNAKEEIKTHLQAKTKKELEDEIKVLRRRLVFKASPMPSFYREGPPQMTGIPKAPTTRPRSPNFSRRHSHSGFSGRPCDLHCEAGEHNSKSPHKHDTSDSNRSFSFRSVPGPTHERPIPKSPSSARSSNNVDLEAAELRKESDVKIKMKGPATISPLPIASDLIISNDEEQDHVAKVQIKQVAVRSAGMNNSAMRKTNAIPPVIKSPSDIQGKASNGLQVHSNSDDRIFLPSTSKTKSDGNGSEEFINKTVGKERLKSITSYFTSRGTKSVKSFTSSTQDSKNKIK